MLLKKKQYLNPFQVEYIYQFFVITHTHTHTHRDLHHDTYTRVPGHLNEIDISLSFTTIGEK